MLLITMTTRDVLPELPMDTRLAMWRVVRVTLLPAGLLVCWYLLYSRLAWFAEWCTYVWWHFPRVLDEPTVLPKNCCGTLVIVADHFTPAVRLGRAVAFLLYQVPHTFLLLALVVAVMGVVRSFFSPERTRAVLAGKHGWTGTLLAAFLGVATPFCSCSAVPLFVGFVTAGVPLGATLSFLIAAPLVNEVALAILVDQFGWIVAGLYLLTGLVIALISGVLLGRLPREQYLETWVTQITATAVEAPEERMTWEDRLHRGGDALRDILGRVWIYVLLGLLAGTVIQAYVTPQQLIMILGAEHWWSVPLAVLIGVPLYANPAGILPVVQALLGKGIALGTVLAFMMAVTGLSLPEFIILRRVMRPRLLIAFAGIVTLGILCVGVLFNLAFQ